MPPQAAIHTSQADAEAFRRRLIASLQEEPIEDGIAHAAERLIRVAFIGDPGRARGLLTQTLSTLLPDRPAISASLLRCVGRLEFSTVDGWGLDLASDALDHPEAEVREAAVRCLESWGGPDALALLHGHHESEGWLHSYIQQVILDLSGATS